MRRRAVRRHAFNAEVADCAEALGELFGGSPSLDDPDHVLRASAGQRRILERIKTAVADLGSPPEGMTASGAFTELRGAGSYQEDTPANLGSYHYDRLSIPACGSEPVSLAKLWGEGGVDVVAAFEQQVLLPESERLESLAACPVRRPYSDRALSRRGEWARFLAALEAAGVVEYAAPTPHDEVVGIFFVKKKDGRLRMVLDCRRSNACFLPSDAVELATGASFAQMELGEGEILYTGTADIKDAFYHLELPASLRPFFALKSVLVGDVGVSEIGGQPVPPSTRLSPRLKVVPMGWSWALWWCQSVHMKIAHRAGFRGEALLRDRHAVPSLRTGVSPSTWTTTSRCPSTPTT